MVTKMEFEKTIDEFYKIMEDDEERLNFIKLFVVPIRNSVSYEKFKSDFSLFLITNPEKSRKYVESYMEDYKTLSIEQDTDKPDMSMKPVVLAIEEEILANPLWNDFLEKEFTVEGVDGILSHPTKFYSAKKDSNGKTNYDRYYLSIDLVTANWQSLTSILGWNVAFEDKLKEVTDLKTPHYSKKVRASIASKSASSAILDYNKYLLMSKKTKILEYLNNVDGFKVDKDVTPFAIYADEFLIEISASEFDALNKVDLSELESVLEKEVGLKLHVRPFYMSEFGINKSAIKVYKNKEVII